MYFVIYQQGVPTVNMPWKPEPEMPMAGHL